MSAMKKAAVALVSASVVGVGAAVWTAGAASGQPAAATTAKLTAAEQSGLTFTREEERMARELYALFADKYGTAPFSTISASEQRHFDAVGVVLTRYAVSDPAEGAKAGVYADATLQKLYDGWKASGLTSVKAAYQVGVALEKRDVADLKKLQDATANTDLDRLYSRLENGSTHHLAAFTAAAEGTTLPGPGAGGPGNGPAARPGPGNGPANRPGNGAGNGPGNGAGLGGQARGAGHGPGHGPGAGNGNSGDCPYA